MTFTPGRPVGSPEQDVYLSTTDPGASLPHGTAYTWHEVDATGAHVDTWHKVAGRADLAVSQLSTFARVRAVSASYGDGVTDATTHIQSVIDAANTAGHGVYVPAGTYLVSAPIEDVRRLHLAAGATIRANASIAAVLRSRIGTRWDRGTITGSGTVDAGTNAAIGIHLRDFLHYEVSGVQVMGGTTAAIQAGDAGSSARSAEAILSNLRLYNSGSVVAGSRGILVVNAGDHSISQVLIQNYEYGIDLPVAGNAIVHDVHVWSEPSKGATKVSFLDSSNNSHYTACHADTPTEYGFRLYGYQTTLVQCGTYNNPDASTATDGVAIAVKFEAANAIGTVIAHYSLGGSAAHRLAADIETADGNYGLIHWHGCSSQHLVTQRTLSSRAIGLTVRDTVAGGVLAADKTAVAADIGLSIRTNGAERWRIASDGAAESGANAGSGLSIRRYADNGTALGEVLYIARSSGTIVSQSSISIADAKNIVVGSTTGTQIGTASTQKIGFFGNTPVVKPSALTAADNATINTGDAASDTAITNMRLRILQIETRLQALGLIT